MIHLCPSLNQIFTHHLLPLDLFTPPPFKLKFMLKTLQVTLEVIIVIAQINLHFMNPFSLVHNNHEKFLISFHG